MTDNEKYCTDARKLLGVETICGKGCPIYGIAGEDCPRLIMEDATDKAIGKAMKKIVRLINEKK